MTRFFSYLVKYIYIKISLLILYIKLNKNSKNKDKSHIEHNNLPKLNYIGKIKIYNLYFEKKKKNKK